MRSPSARRPARPARPVRPVRPAPPRTLNRQIAQLAIPALGALIAEPLFLIVDSAMVGRLGTAPLAGLAIAGVILNTVIGLLVFLAYATTARVARLRGAGDLRGAVQSGVDGMWFAAALGAVVAVVLWLLSAPLVTVFGAAATPETVTHAQQYLAVSCLGVPAMLCVFAANGMLRGLQDTRTPLRVATVGFAANAVLNWVAIFVFGWGIAGSAWGTVLAQWGMVAWFLAVIARHRRTSGAAVLPRRSGLVRTGRSGGWLFLRTLGLRAALLVTVYAAASHGTATTAAYHIVFTLFSTAAFALDALAVAAQALVGEALGARDANRVREVVRRCTLWGVGCGVALGILLALSSPVLGAVFTSDALVRGLLLPALLVLAASLPLCGAVFVADGVLMGAGDARYLAWTSFAMLLVYVPLLWLVATLVPSGVAATTMLTVMFGVVLMALRAGVLGIRLRGSRWIVLGV